jgi:tetratricopeptide (TPR) repeat protein
VALDPDEGEYQYQLGWVLWSNGDYGRALEHLQQALALGDDRDAVYTMLGIAYGNIGSYDEALQYYQEGLDTHSDSVILHLSVGELYLAQEQCEEAIVELEWVLDQDPGNELALEYWQECDAILHPPPTAMPGAPTPPPTGTITQEEAKQLGTNIVEGTGATVDEQLFDTGEGAVTWMVNYVSQHSPGSDQFDEQQTRIVLGLSEVTMRIEPPVVILGVVALESSGEEYNGVIVMSIFVEKWQEGIFSDEEFIESWIIIEP